MPRLTAASFLFAMCIASILSGCGTYVPSIQEIGDDKQGKELVEAIISSVRCELKNAVTQIYWDDLTTWGGIGQRRTEFFDKWGALVQLQLTVEEKTTLNPSVSWMPNAIFSLAGSANLSSDATRINKINYFYKVADLQKGGCITGALKEPHPPGSLLIQSDLKLYNWLSSLLLPITAGDITTLNTDSAITHEVKFEVVSTGSVGPEWKLSRVFSVNPSGTLFSTSRDRTHDLLITFGPILNDKLQELTTNAQNAFFASQINSLGTTSRIISP